MSKAQISARVMDVEEVSTVLGIHRTKVYQLARDGKLPGAFRLDKRILISRQVFDAFLSNPKWRLSQADDE